MITVQFVNAKDLLKKHTPIEEKNKKIPLESEDNQIVEEYEGECEECEKEVKEKVCPMCDD